MRFNVVLSRFISSCCFISYLGKNNALLTLKYEIRRIITRITAFNMVNKTGTLMRVITQIFFKIIQDKISKNKIYRISIDRNIFLLF